MKCSAADEPRHLVRYLEGLDALTAGRWAEAVAIFDETTGTFGRDGRPWIAKGVALTMQRQFAPAVAAFNESGLRGFRGREPELWRYVVERMTNGVVDPGHGISGPRSLGGQRFFSGMPGHMIQGKDDYPTNYASFLYYNMATPIGEALAAGRPVDTPEIRGALLEGARWFANRARAAPDLGRALYFRAEALAVAGDMRGALSNLGIIRISYPDDWLVAALASDCWLGAGRFATVRREASLALVNAPDNAYSLVRRAYAAARLGRPAQARADLKLARVYNDAEVKPHLAGLEQTIADAEKGAAGDPAKLRRNLEELAAGAATDDELLRAALALARAVERNRLYYDEYYTAEIRNRADQVRKRPKDPAPLAALAGFIIDEARSDRRGEALETGRPVEPYRPAADDTRDLRRALTLADQALALDPRHVPAHMQRARALARLGETNEAERVVAAALKIAPNDPLALRMQGRFWIERANGMLMQAALLRTPTTSVNSWTETRSDGIYRVTETTYHPPSAAALRNADQLENQASQLLRQAGSAIQAALDATKGTLEGDLLAADVALSRGDLAAVEAAVRAALKRDPKSVAAYDILADAHRRAGRIDAADDTRSSGANLLQTTAGWKLRIAWRQLEGRDFQAARRTLDDAARIDPADARVDALRGELARLERRQTDARASWRVAYALGAAALAVDDQPPKPLAAPFGRDALQFGLVMAMRERLAGEATAEEALRLVQANAAVEAQLSPGGLAVQMFSAMLPDPDAPRIPARVPDNMSELLVRAHVGSARLLLRANRTSEAMASYRAAARYAPPGGSARTPMIADGRGNRQNSNFAHFAKGPELGEALIALARDAIRRRDVAAAQIYMEQAGATRVPDDQRAQLNQLNFDLARIMQGGR